MKGTITQYITLGVMLLLMVLIVSMYPEHAKQKATSRLDVPTKVSKLSIQTRVKTLRAD